MSRKPRQAHIHHLVLAALAACLVAGRVAADNQAETGRYAVLVYRSPSGVTFEVTAAGLGSVRFRGHEVAHGGSLPPGDVAHIGTDRRQGTVVEEHARVDGPHDLAAGGAGNVRAVFTPPSSAFPRIFEPF